jgi:hypothetical protein
LSGKRSTGLKLEVLDEDRGIGGLCTEIRVVQIALRLRRETTMTPQRVAQVAPILWRSDRHPASIDNE